jgi:hypothetical protein
MVRCAFAILLCTIASRFLTSQADPRHETAPSVSVSLPAGIPSETVQIVYHMVGPFGGSGGYTEQRADLHSYEIAASVDGKAATEIKMLVYASGCEIQTFVIPLADSSRFEREFECQPVPRVVLSGQVVPSDLVLGKSTELIVTYMAFWAHEFFGIVDGAVAEIRVATVSPDANGMFQVDLPQFNKDASRSTSGPRASLHLLLRDSNTLNPIAYNLEPEVPGLRSEDHGLRIRSDYPNGLKFAVWPSSEPRAQVPQGSGFRVLTRTRPVANIKSRAVPRMCAALLNSATEAPVRTLMQVLAGGCASAVGSN